MNPWARIRKHGPCIIFDWHASMDAAQKAIDACAEKEGEQIRKFQTVAYFPYDDKARIGNIGIRQPTAGESAELLAAGLSFDPNAFWEHKTIEQLIKE